MKQVIQIRCKNNKKTLNVAIGSTLSDIFRELNLKMDYGPISAKVNNKVEGLHFRVYHNKDIEYLDIKSPSGARAYTRTLFFVLCKAVHDLWPGADVVIDIPVSNGYYCNINMRRPITEADARAVRERMQQIIDAAIPIRRHECSTEEVIDMFTEMGMTSKVKLLRSVGSLYTTYYEIDGYKDYYYGTLLTNTRQLYLFGLEKYYDGMLLRIPSRDDPSRLGDLVKQDKMFEIFKEHHRWQKILGMSTVGDFNEAVKAGHSTELVNVSEALQEKKISQIADMIAARPGVRMVLISGPSSSGKTTFCKRLSIQLLTCGVKPVPISLDDYFVDRELTPKDDNGEYDYESLYALNIELLNKQLNALFAGEEVELPHYDFKNSVRVFDGRTLRRRPGELVILEGIHALNPEVTGYDGRTTRIYVSVRTRITPRSGHPLHPSKIRLVRRMLRDSTGRGRALSETIAMRERVDRGEQRYIMPFKPRAHGSIDSFYSAELGVYRPLLRDELERLALPELSDVVEVMRELPDVPADLVPQDSLLREFIGGSTLPY